MDYVVDVKCVRAPDLPRGAGLLLSAAAAAQLGIISLPCSERGCNVDELPELDCMVDLQKLWFAWSGRDDVRRGGHFADRRTRWTMSVTMTTAQLPAKKTDGLEKTDGLGFVGFCGEKCTIALKRAYPVVFGCYCYRNHCDLWLPQ